MERKKKPTVKKSAAPKIKDLDAQQRKLALVKQKKCDAVALHIVNKLLESSVEEDVFLQSLKYINQCHYQDIVEERAISKMCGYPVCKNALPNMPKKQYHISTKSNKIYDITDRKNYCSNYCYKAGIYIKEQMLTSPLWFRDKEEIPDFHLLPTTVLGIPGEEIDQGMVKLDVNKEDNKFTSVSEFTQDAINQVTDSVADKLHINTHKNDKEELKTETKEETKNNEEEKEIQYYSNLYMPNLADILQENAKYFSENANETPTNSEWKPGNEKTKINNSESTKSRNETNSESKETFDKVTTKAQLNENHIKSSKTFDRTIIDNKLSSKENSNSKQLKGILSKSSKIDNNSEKKKQVSFSAHNEEKFIRQLNPNKQFKKPGAKNADDSPRIFKNTNLIGSVREKSEIYKIDMACINLTKSEYDINLTNGTNYSAISNRSMESKHILEHNSQLNATDKIEVPSAIINKLTLESKETRKSRLKSSATYRNANKLSQSARRNEIILSTFGNFKERLQKYIREYTTYETVIFLYGERIKEKVSLADKQTALCMDKTKQKQYDSICKRLNLMELADRKFDQSVTGKKLRPLPRYEELQKEAEAMNLKVQAFYSGCYEILEEDAESETESVKEEEISSDKGPPAVLPLVESKDIVPLRKKIFLTSLSRIIPNICEILKLCPNSLLSDLKKLIDTFELTAENIIFKASEWYIVGIVLVKMLSIRDNSIRKVMEENEAETYLQKVLSEFSLKLKNLEEFLLTETEVCAFVQTVTANH